MAKAVYVKREGKNSTPYTKVIDAGPDPVTGKRRQSRISARTQKELDQKIAEFMVKREKGTLIDTTTMTVAEYMKHWLDNVAAHKVRPGTLEDYRWVIKKHILPHLGGFKIAKLTASMVQAYLSEHLTKNQTPRTTQLCYMRLDQVLAHAVRMGDLPRNVCEMVDRPKHTQREMAIWSPAEVRSFLVATEGDGYNPLWLLALTTGMRQGELLGLRWQDVDFKASAINVRQAVTLLAGLPHVSELKTPSARRSIMVDPDTVAALKGHRAYQVQRQLKAGPAWQDEDLVFTTPTGGPLNANNVTRNYKRLIVRAGVPDIRFHDLRHTHATLLLADGKQLKMVSDRLGHAKVSTTLDIYTHAVPGMQEGAVSAMTAMLHGDDKQAAV